jgi:hypothetical protein
MSVRLAVTLVGLGLAVSVEPMLAHHSIAAEYDLSKTITIKGTVTNKRAGQISVDALEAKDGAKLGYARAVTWPDGRILSVPRDNFFDSIPK